MSQVLWTPPAELVASCTMGRFLRWVEGERGVAFAGYEDAWRWSVDDLPGFWAALWRFLEVEAEGSPERVLASARMPGAEWFPDVRLSYAEHVFRGKPDDAVAILAACELREDASWTWGELREQTARIRAGLRAMGVDRGDRVAAYLPNIPEAVAAFLATASLGAVWSASSPDFGVQSVVDRFSQIAPKVLLAVDGYRYGGRDFDRRDAVARLRAELRGLEHTVVLPYLFERGDWDAAFPPSDEPLAFERVPFAHPLWILYSSGTTGLPKPIVHGHGGILLEHLKELHLHVDARAGDRILWFTTTGWMMWNFLVSALLTEAAVVLYDGHPGRDTLWELAARTGTTCLGTGAAYLHSCLKAGVEPAAGRDLSALRAVGSTGSPLSPEGFQWVYDQLGSDVWLFSISGGTDVCSAFVGGCPLVPVRRGELQARALGAAVHAFDERGRPVVDQVGELVITQPMPSMPLYLWGDDDGSRYRESYFDTYPGVWRHGDWIRITPEGGAVIYGRSDSTINRGGIRMGTSEIYRAALGVEAVQDALVVDVPPPDGMGPGWMPLFVVLAEDEVLDDQLAAEISRRIRTECSPRHVPDDVLQVRAIPRTLSGKVLEVPVKRILMGEAADRVVSADALADPAALDWFARFASTRTRPGAA